MFLSRGLQCSRGTLLAWERGFGRTSREPFASDLVVIAAGYNCSVNDLFTALLDGIDVPFADASSDDDNSPEAQGKIAAIHSKLTDGGWSCGDALSSLPSGSSCWIVIANRGEQKVIGRGSTRVDAWEAAGALANGMVT